MERQTRRAGAGMLKLFGARLRTLKVGAGRLGDSSPYSLGDREVVAVGTMRETHPCP